MTLDRRLDPERVIIDDVLFFRSPGHHTRTCVICGAAVPPGAERYVPIRRARRRLVDHEALGGMYPATSAGRGCAPRRSPRNPRRPRPQHLVLRRLKLPPRLELPDHAGDAGDDLPRARGGRSRDRRTR